jgi:tetratricopeptide (TPR) repeat protein
MMNSPDLVTWLRFDQRQRWQKGERIQVEAYLQERPTLRDAAEAVLDLVYNEIVLREERGETPQLEEYLRRFPQYANDLRLQFDVHRMIVDERVPLGESTAESRGLSPNGHAERSRRPPPVIDGYEILGELGRGGMGVVYRARQLDLKRMVALKMIRSGVHASAHEQARFLIEAEAVARLQHPNIVQIHAVGQQDGSSFFALEFVDGTSIDKKFGRAVPPPRQAAQLVETIARAMHYAHQRGIVHRDLKPSNVLLGSDGVPKITDFGLAKLLDVQGGQTPPEGLIGTPNYMAPEQAAGNNQEIGPRADVYSLGAILYELLTGRPPFEGLTMAQTLERVRSQDPVPPRSGRPGVPRELETICLKCLEKQPAARYGSALELADDLRRFLADEPILARPAGRWERVVKWVRRRPAAAALVFVSALAVLSLLVFALWHKSEVENTVEQTRTGEMQALERARAKLEAFQRYHDEALFYGIHAALFPRFDAAENIKAMKTAAQHALELVNLDLKSDSPPVLDAHWNELEKAETISQCYEMLLLLSEAIAQPHDDQPVELNVDHARQAMAVLDRAAGLAPRTRISHLRKAVYLTQLGDAAGAAAERALAATLKPAGIDYFLSGYYLLEQDKPELAAKDFLSALSEQPKDFWSRYFLAGCYLRLDRAAEAEALLQQCRDQRGEFVDTYLLLGVAHEKAGSGADPEMDYQQALELNPNKLICYFIYVDRGRLRLGRGKLEEAAADFRQAIALQPKRYEAFIGLAAVYQQQKRFGDSLQELEKALRLSMPATERIHHLYFAKRYEDCVRACDAALARQPKDAKIHHIRGQALLQLERYGEALRAFDCYRDFGGKPAAGVSRERGLAHLHLGEYVDAVDDYSFALALQPDADLFLARGWAYFFVDAWKLALRDFQKVLELDRNVTDAYVGRGLAYIMLGQHVEAVADAEEAMRPRAQRTPMTAPMMHNIACIFTLASAKVENDTSIAEGKALAISFRARAIEAVRQTLAMLPPHERQAFWREKILPDKALRPILPLPEFQQLGKAITGGQPAQ